MNPQDLNETLLLHHHNDTSESSSEQKDLPNVPSSASDVTDIIKNGGDLEDDNHNHSEYVSFHDLEEKQRKQHLQEKLNSSIYSKEGEEESSLRQQHHNDERKMINILI